jgi:hypothetical protein
LYTELTTVTPFLVKNTTYRTKTLSGSPPSWNLRNSPAYTPVFRPEIDTAKSRIFELLLLPLKALIVIKLTPASAFPDTENSKNPHSRTASLLRTFRSSGPNSKNSSPGVEN